MGTNNFNRVAIWLLAMACVFKLCGDLQAQTGGTPQAQAKSKTFRVAGRVVSALDGHPLARAQVFLTNTKKRQKPQLATADDNGQFEFNQVEEGKYSLEGMKTGFIRQAYKQHENFSTAIVTGAEIATDDLILSLAPTGTLSVKVLDESSEPLRKASVRLYREDRSTGIREIVGFRGALTDDLGSCDFTRLDPGTYYLGVTATPWYAIHPAGLNQDGQNSLASDVRSFDVVYSPTYYGDTTDPDSATPIAIKAGDHTETEIHLNPVQALHLIFHATEDSQHGIATPVIQSVGFDGRGTPQMGQTQRISPGLFEITGIAPGRYTVSLPGSSPVQVDAITDGQDLSQAKGEATSTVSVSTRVLGEAKVPQPLYIQLRRKDGKFGAAQGVDEKGQTDFTNVSPGEYNILVGSPGKNYFVTSVATQSGETSGHSLNILSGSSLSVSLAVVGGTVNVEGSVGRGGKAVAGAMIVLVPAHPESDKDLFRRDQSDLDGTFSLQNVSPGSYTVVAIDDGWDMDWALPAVIEPYLKSGETVTIDSRSRSSVHLPKIVEVQPRK